MKQDLLPVLEKDEVKTKFGVFLQDIVAEKSIHNASFCEQFLCVLSKVVGLL